MFSELKNTEFIVWTIFCKDFVLQKEKYIIIIKDKKTEASSPNRMSDAEFMVILILFPFYLSKQQRQGKPPSASLSSTHRIRGIKQSKYG